MSEQTHDNPIRPFVDVDEARERPQRLEDLENQPDEGTISDDFTDTSPNVDEADGLPGNKADIYERGVTILPPG